MWRATAYFENYILSEYTDDIDWFKSAHSKAFKFKFERVY